MAGQTTYVAGKDTRYRSCIENTAVSPDCPKTFFNSYSSSYPLGPMQRTETYGGSPELPGDTRLTAGSHWINFCIDRVSNPARCE